MGHFFASMAVFWRVIPAPKLLCIKVFYHINGTFTIFIKFRCIREMWLKYTKNEAGREASLLPRLIFGKRSVGTFKIVLKKAILIIISR